MSIRQPRHQQGMTLISWLIVITIGLFFTLISVKMVPTYLEHYSIVQILESMSEDRSVRKMSRRDIKETVFKRFRINGIYEFPKEDLEVVKGKDGYKVSADYEVRKPVFGNVFIVMTFSKSVVIRPLLQ